MGYASWWLGQERVESWNENKHERIDWCTAFGSEWIFSHAEFHCNWIVGASLNISMFDSFFLCVFSIKCAILWVSHWFHRSCRSLPHLLPERGIPITRTTQICCTNPTCETWRIDPLLRFDHSFGCSCCKSGKFDGRTKMFLVIGVKMQDFGCS